MTRATPSDRLPTLTTYGEARGRYPETLRLPEEEALERALVLELPEWEGFLCVAGSVVWSVDGMDRMVDRATFRSPIDAYGFALMYAVGLSNVGREDGPDGLDGSMGERAGWMTVVDGNGETR